MAFVIVTATLKTLSSVCIITAVYYCFWGAMYCCKLPPYSEPFPKLLPTSSQLLLQAISECFCFKAHKLDHLVLPVGNSPQICSLQPDIGQSPGSFDETENVPH